MKISYLFPWARLLIPEPFCDRVKSKLPISSVKMSTKLFFIISTTSFASCPVAWNRNIWEVKFYFINFMHGPRFIHQLVDWFGKTGLNWYFYCLEPMQKNPFNSMEQVKKTNSLHISPSLSVRPSLWPQWVVPMIQVVVLWWVYSCGTDGYASGPSRILVVR